MIGKKLKGLLCLMSISAMFCLSVPVMADGTDTSVHSNKSYTSTSLYGNDRFETSKQIALQYDTDTGKCNGVILALGTNFPDALSGSILAQKYKVPVLLTGATTSESTTAMSFIKSNVDKNKPIYILGGNGGIKDDVINTLKSEGYTNIIRLGGLDRYDTNAEIIKNFSPQTGTPVVIANGENFPDALSISSIAANKGYPVLLTAKDKISDTVKAQLKSINPSKIYVAGGTASVSDSNLSDIESSLGISNSNVVRLGGADRYATSLAIAKYFSNDSTSDTVTFANGENFPDALSGSALSALNNAPLVLISANSDDVSQQKQFIDSTKSTKVLFYGGSGVISDTKKNILLGKSQDNNTSTSLPSTSLPITNYKFSTTIDTKVYNHSTPFQKYLDYQTKAEDSIKGKKGFIEISGSEPLYQVAKAMGVNNMLISKNSVDSLRPDVYCTSIDCNSASHFDTDVSENPIVNNNLSENISNPERFTCDDIYVVDNDTKLTAYTLSALCNTDATIHIVRNDKVVATYNTDVKQKGDLGRLAIGLRFNTAFDVDVDMPDADYEALIGDNTTIPTVSSNEAYKVYLAYMKAVLSGNSEEAMKYIDPNTEGKEFMSNFIKNANYGDIPNGKNCILTEKTADMVESASDTCVWFGTRVNVEVQNLLTSSSQKNLGCNPSVALHKVNGEWKVYMVI